MARIIHMLSYTSITHLWSRAYSVLARSALDDKENRDVYKIALADVFNDYGAYVYQNPCVVLKDGKRFAVPELSFSFRKVCDFNPNLPVEIRDHSWLWGKVNLIRAGYTKIQNKYHSSGHGETGGNGREDDEIFFDYCEGNSLWLYAFICFGGDSVLISNMIAKVLDEDTVSESHCPKQSAPRLSKSRRNAEVDFNTTKKTFG